MNYFFKSIEADEITGVAALLEKDPGLIFTVYEHNRTPLFYAHSKKMAELLLKYGADINARDSHGNTPLYTLTCQINGKETIEFLLATGADVNAKNNNGSTPLHNAVDYGYSDLVELLISRNADVNAQDNEGNTPLKIALAETPDNWNDIVECLIRNGAQIRDIKEAVQIGNISLTEPFLKEKPEQINIQNSHGFTPLHIAICYAHEDIAKFLIAANADINIASKTGRTALHYASKYGTLKIVEFLVSKGADINAVDRTNMTPLQVAIDSNHFAIADLLRQHGAKE